MREKHRVAVSKHGNDDAEAHCDLGRRHDDDHEDEDLAVYLTPCAREPDQRHVHGVEHELDGHEDHDQVAARHRPHQPDDKEDPRESEDVIHGDGHSRLRFASTTAPTMAARSSSDVTSKGSTKSM